MKAFQIKVNGKILDYRLVGQPEDMLSVTLEKIRENYGLSWRRPRVSGR